MLMEVCSSGPGIGISIGLGNREFSVAITCNHYESPVSSAILAPSIYTTLRPRGLNPTPISGSASRAYRRYQSIGIRLQNQLGL
jgi:hypothetical protein